MLTNNFGVVGIDYSMSCPAACYHPINVAFSSENCSWIFLTEQTKFQGIFLDGRIRGLKQEPWETDIERFDLISKPFLDFIKNSKEIGIEGYAMGSSAGRVFNIAENTAILKHGIWKQSKNIHIIPPKTVKKFATSSGNADKNLMYDSFVKETNIVLTNELNLNKIPTKIGSPISDIVDSYYICKYVYNMLTI